VTDIHTFFGLSYVNYLVISPERVTLPLTRLLDQLAAAYDRSYWPERLALRSICIDAGSLTEQQMRDHGITTNLDFLHDGCHCEPEPKPLPGESDADFGDHDFQPDDDPHFGSAFGGACGAQVETATRGRITCGWPRLAHRTPPQ
jgi:hypothetical protein